MITNILRYVGVICAALVIGYIVGVRNGHDSSVGKTVIGSSETRETEKSTTTTETTERPDGSKTTRTVTETERRTSKDDRKETPAPAKERPRQFRTTVAVRPEWQKEKSEIKGHPVIAVGKRLLDSPAWADIIIDVDRKEVAVGISIEW